MGAETRRLYVSHIHVSGLRCFRGAIDMDLLAPQGPMAGWNVILGENGTGKTTLLRALAAAAPVCPPQVVGLDPSGHMFPLLHSPIVLASLEGASKRGPIVRSDYHFPGAASPKSTVTLTSGGDGRVSGTGYSLDIGELHPPLVAYGAHRRSSTTELGDDLPGLGIETLFDDNAELLNVEEWLLRLKLDTLLRGEPESASARELAAVEAMLPGLLPDVERVEIPKPPPERRAGDLRNLVVFHTPDGPVPFSGLSLGYRTIAALAVDFAARLFRAWPESDDPLAEPAICLVDEIDLHLHPRWQHAVVPYLRTRFPRTQFIVTTHSPLVVQASGDDAHIVVLRRDDKGDVVADSDPASVASWRVDQILTSDLFGLSSSRAPEVEAKLARRRLLLRSQRRTEEEDVELATLDAFAVDLPTLDGQDDAALQAVRALAARLQPGARSPR